MGMTLNQFASFRNAMNDPVGAMVRGVESGTVLKPEWFSIAEGHIRTITEDWIPSEQEALEHHTFYNPQFPDSEDGQAITKRIEKWRGWAIKNLLTFLYSSTN